MSQIFTIARGSELPCLEMELIEDGRTDFRKFYLAIQNTRSVTFSMTNLSTGIKKIAKAPAEIALADDRGCEERYILRYRWKKRDTDEEGTFAGQFHIDFSGNIYKAGTSFPSGELVVPIQEELRINIVGGGIYR